MKSIAYERVNSKNLPFCLHFSIFTSKNVTYIKKAILGIPVRTLYKYRQTYYGEVKDCETCNLAK